MAADAVFHRENALTYVAGYYLGIYCECPRCDYHGDKAHDIKTRIVLLLHSLT